MWHKSYPDVARNLYLNGVFFITEKHTLQAAGKAPAWTPPRIQTDYSWVRLPSVRHPAKMLNFY